MSTFEKMVLVPTTVLDHFHQKQLEEATIRHDPIKTKAMQLYEELKNILSDKQLSEDERGVRYADTLQQYLTTLSQHQNKIVSGPSSASIPTHPPSLTPITSVGKRDLHDSPPQLPDMFLTTPPRSPRRQTYTGGESPRLNKKKTIPLSDSHQSPTRTSRPRTRSQARQEWLKDWITW